MPFNVSFYERLQNLTFYFIIFAQPLFIDDSLDTMSVVSLSSLLDNGMVNNNGFGKMTLLLNGKSVLTILQCMFNMCQLIMGSFQLQWLCKCLLDMIIIRDEFGVNSYRPFTPDGKNI